MNNAVIASKHKSWFSRSLGVVLILIGVVMTYGGAVLVSLNGSPYYALAGLFLVVSGVFFFRQNLWGVWIYALIYGATILWAVGEVGLQLWALAPRIIAPTVLAIPVCLSLIFLPQAEAFVKKGGDGLGKERRLPLKRMGYAGAALMVLALVGFGIAAFNPQGVLQPDAETPATGRIYSDASAGWTAYGRTNEGRRFAPLNQINKQNVGALKIAWIARTGDIPTGGAADENTPLQVGNRLFTCSPHNIVHALDVDTGKILWTYNPRVEAPFWQRCRSVAFHESPAAKICAARIVIATMDARLIEIDANSGKPCPDFGKAGTVDLREGLGEVKPGYYFMTSAPTIAKGLIIIGGAVVDNADLDVPSGVVRAFDANTGSLRWVWDLGNVRDSNALPGKETVFTRGTPNVWAPPSVDEARGLVFLPTGNPAADHWGGARSKESERHTSAIVALDLATGKKRWTFQTVHHDLWDYDLPSQPTLADIPDGRGGRIPAVIQPTKRGQIFVLDRRTGVPVAPVAERPVPQGAAPGDWTFRTQPYSVGMPAIGAKRLTEADMWGATPFDQLWCRIAFRRLRYQGDFTPPGTDPSLLYPGVFGGMNWGSASIDETRDYLIVNDIRVAHKLVLIPRADADREGPGIVKRFGGPAQPIPGHGGFQPQNGTPFAAIYLNFLSPLGIPCQAPPYGTLTAIDMKTRSIAWQIPMGTMRDTGPLNIKMRLPLPMGLPTIGGPLVTGAGLIFFAGTQDFYLRAIDSATGRELWKGRLPVGAGATPMTYISPTTKKQYVVISASGSRESPDTGDYVIAYALP
ncbi:membrane-bound PQQ-dependent dehydrogenase, glucose/quinate/shikimate family [Sphingobium chlorophenolicum]|uniref:Membrane-bound PQQ-dependent dehydrogenase, glucose/quinate/shikimate family n=1 Tax=Sphingobium chlorophenolicum TaxID=46429 RepID=A0A081R9D7_SPHCR|nr:membrane-bound PQQ-dependent dehydrogenase, glucose/quinate/shikimate family [Sphingobium chlorophenolicum]KEQ51810.1 Membrane-bound PQQ-dependent dehydrogenase, glucose/quinate/shikimate family [Sphingobium chlorophenolicum]